MRTPVNIPTLSPLKTTNMDTNLELNNKLRTLRISCTNELICRYTICNLAGTILLKGEFSDSVEICLEEFKQGFYEVVLFSKDYISRHPISLS